MRHLAHVVFWIAVFPTSGVSQLNEVTKKTIEIRSTEKVTSPAETATVKIGYQNQASTKEAAYEENNRAANKIVLAIKDAGVPAGSIETESLSLEREEERSGINVSHPPKYTAEQDWRIHVRASDAQKILDISVAAGANQVSSVEWGVVDPQALEMKAYAAALTRAKFIAEKTAAEGGVKLGEILSIVNSVSPFARPFPLLQTSASSLSTSVTKITTPLKLFPPLIEREASVTVTYAIAP